MTSLANSEAHVFEFLVAGMGEPPSDIAHTQGHDRPVDGITSSGGGSPRSGRCGTTPKTEERIRTFCVLTCEPNEMMATIHNRMPVVLGPADYNRWLMDEDPRDLLRPFPAELMTMWPINSKVGSPKNDTPDILDREEPIRTDLFD